MTLALVDPRQLKRLRLQLGMTQARLAREAGVSQSLIAKIEAGMVDPAFSSLKAISEVLSSSRATAEKKAADVMSSPVISVQTAEKLSDCIALMKKRGISQMPVLEGGALRRFSYREWHPYPVGRESRAGEGLVSTGQKIHGACPPSRQRR